MCGEQVGQEVTAMVERTEKKRCFYQEAEQDKEGTSRQDPTNKTNKLLREEEKRRERERKREREADNGSL